MSSAPRSPRVLIIDADEDEASLVEEYLREGLKEPGLDVRRATSAAAARAELEAAPPDVLLLDVGLRDEEALAFVASLREGGVGIPTVVLTGRANAESARQALRVGAWDVLVKASATRGNYRLLSLPYDRGCNTLQTVTLLTLAVSGAAVREDLPGSIDPTAVRISPDLSASPRRRTVSASTRWVIRSRNGRRFPTPSKRSSV